MIVEHLNTFLQSPSTLLSTPLFVFITGASGAGKSYLTQVLERELDPKFVRVEYFDRIGVPEFEDMVKEYGSGEKWQEAMTHQWVQQLVSEKDKKVVILEGQFNPQFAVDACNDLGITHYSLILFHANKKVREHRLIEHRVQPELANETMDNWAEFLKHKTQELGGTIINTSDSDIHSPLNEIMKAIENKLQTISLK